MGIVDNDILQDINTYIKSLHTPYRFKSDDGSFETAIEFWAMGYYHPPRSQNWDESKKRGNQIKCPDLLEYNHKLIIEYEEEPKPGKNMGKMGRKGHTSESKKDTNRDMLYRIGGFKLLKIWESEYKDGSYIKKLELFLNGVS